MKTCKMNGCNEKHCARGYCIKHYMQKKTTGEFGKSMTTRVRITAVYHAMRHRCLDPKSDSWQYYGGRGIKICDEWMTFQNFYEWAIQGYKPGLQIDRVDNDKGYSPENCEWVTPKQQQRNRRDNIWTGEPGDELLLVKLSEIYDLKYKTIKTRYYRGDRGANLVRPVIK